MTEIAMNTAVKQELESRGVDETTGVYTMYKNDAFFMSNYKLVDYEGHFAVLFETPFGKAYLYDDNGEIVCVALSSSL